MIQEIKQILAAIEIKDNVCLYNKCPRCKAPLIHSYKKVRCSKDCEWNYKGNLRLHVA